MDNTGITQELARHAPGLFGAVAAMLWIKDTWPRRVGFTFAGASASHYASGAVAAWSGMDEGLAGFLVGLFSMAIAAKVFEALEAFKSSDLVDRLLKRAGL